MCITLLLWAGYALLLWGDLHQPQKGGEYTSMCEGPHPFIPAADTVRVDMIYNTLGGTAENVYHVHAGSTPVDGNMDLIAASFLNWEEDVASLARASSVSLKQIIVTDLSVENGERFVATPVPAIIGDLESPVMPNNVTLAIKTLTNRGGRSFNGRHYWIGLTEIQCQGDFIVASARQTLLEDILDLQTRLTTNGWTLAVVSYCSEGAWRLTAEVSDVISFDADNVLDSQRRRLLGRGS
jgi:hypothetical protein